MENYDLQKKEGEKIELVAWAKDIQLCLDKPKNREYEARQASVLLNSYADEIAKSLYEADQVVENIDEVVMCLESLIGLQNIIGDERFKKILENLETNENEIRDKIENVKNIKLVRV